MTYEFTYLRHGESTGNQDGTVQGQYDFPLTANGVSQVRELAQRWLSLGVVFDQIISSPLTRALSTSETIQSVMGIPIRTDPVWMERDCGECQGLSHEEFNLKFPRPAFIQLYDLFGKTGESEWQLYLRAGTALQSLFLNPPGRYLIVSHGGILNKVLHTIFGIKLQADFQGLHFYLNNTAYTRVRYSSDRNQWQMLNYVQPQKVSLGSQNNTREGYRFTFIRHAESQGNINKIFQGQSETPLTEVGLGQADSIGNYFRDTKKRFDRVFSSPQSRALQTAEIICSKISHPIETSDLLKEINNGNLAGLNGDEIDSRFPRREDRTNPYLPVGENGESWLELYLRAMKVVDWLFSNPPGDYLIISHGAMLNAVLWSILGIPPQPSRRSSVFFFENTGICEMSFVPKENLWRFYSFNQSADTSS